MRGNTHMRFLLLSLVIVASCAAAASQRPQPVARPLVILVHGRGQLSLDSASLRKEWKRDLDASLVSVGMPALHEDDVRLAWYADVLDPDSESECAPATDPDDDASLGSIARGFLSSLSIVVSEGVQSSTREARGMIGDLLYLIDASARCGAERRVAQSIQSAVKLGRPVIVVAYSLGSVVAYEHLSKLAADAPRPHDLRFITLGSPLGVPEIRNILLGDGVPALAMPKGVSSWVNVYDPNDAFAAPLDVQGVNSLQDRATQRTESGDPHSIGGYLRDRETGLALARALCASTQELFREGCPRL